MPPRQEALRLAAEAIRDTMMERVGLESSPPPAFHSASGGAWPVWGVRAADDEGNLVAAGTLTVSIRQP
jgi:hypothetical protein